MIFLAVAGFLLFIAYDCARCGWIRHFRVFFPGGCVLVTLSALFAVRKSSLVSTGNGFPPFALWLILSFVFLAGTVYALFFALPRGTYRGTNHAVFDRGIYGLCRHPAFWPFSALSVSLYLLFGGRSMLYEALTLLVCEFVYIVLQDRIYFPRYLEGYSEYRRKVPFLIPKCGRSNLS